MEAPKPDPRLRARRAAFGAVTIAALGILLGLAFVARKFEEIFSSLELRSLPAPTELFLAGARFLRSGPGIAGLALLAAAAAGLSWRGRFDGRHGKSTILVTVGTFVVIGFYVLAVFMPIVRIQASLGR